MKKIRLPLLVAAAVPALTVPLTAQTVRQWSSTSSTAYLTTSNWTPTGTFAGDATVPLAGEGTATDILSVTAGNTITNIGINMNTLTASAGGLGLTVAAVDWSKTSTVATTIGNSSTTTGGVLQLNGATVSSVDRTLIRLAGAANLTFASANSGTATGAQTLGLLLGIPDGVFNVETGRTLTLAQQSLAGSAPATGFSLTGGGTLVLSGASSLTGTLTASSGRIQAAYPGSLGTGSVTVTDGGQIHLLASHANACTLSGNGYFDGSASTGALRLEAFARAAGAVTIAAPARIAVAAGQTGILAGSLSGTAALEINSGDALLSGTVHWDGSGAGFTGPLTVSRGRVNFNSASGPAGAVLISDAAAAGGEGTIAGSLALGSTIGTALYVNGATAEALTAAGGVTANGVTTVIPVEGGPSPLTVLRYSGSFTGSAASFTLPGGIAGYRAGTSFDTSVPGEVRLILPGVLTWTGAASGEWGGTDANWSGGSTTWVDGDCVTFDDSSSAGAVAIAGDVQPLTLTVNNSATAYTFGGFGSVGGSARLVKKGDGLLTLNQFNTYTGGTLIRGGTVNAAVEDAIPNGSSVTVSAGVLRITPVNGIASASSIILGDENTGPGTAVLEIPAAASADQPVISTPIYLHAASPLAKAVLRYPGSDTSGGASTCNSPIFLNGHDLWLENTSNSGNGVIPRLYNVYGRITGEGSVYVTVPGPANRVRIGFNGNDFTGNVYLRSGMLQVGSGAGGTNNCIPNTADIIFSAGTRLGMGTSDVVGALIGGGADPGNSLPAAFINPNTSSASPLLTIGAGDRSGVYDGDIGMESTRSLALTKVGTGTQVLNGTNSSTGAVTVNGGTLVINGTSTGAITVLGAATLAGTGSSAGSVTASSTSAGGAILAPGHPTGTLTVPAANLSNGNLNIRIDDATPARNGRLAVTGALTVTNARLNVSVTGTAGRSLYVIASYGSLVGTFASVVKPDGYDLVYNYNDGVSSGNIALVATADPYLVWASGRGLGSGENAKGADPDNDGIANILEFCLDTDPLVFEAAPVSGSLTGDRLRFTFKRRDDAEYLGAVIETSETMLPASWIAAVDGTSGVTITVTENGAAPDDVVVLIPVNGRPKLMGRLSVTFF